MAFFAFARCARVTLWVSAALAFAFAISPYVFYRSVHLFLAQVWVIPLALIPIVVALRGAPEGREPWGRLRMGAVLIVPSAVVGAAGVYYAFFTLLAWVPAALLLLPRWRQGLALDGRAGHGGRDGRPRASPEQSVRRSKTRLHRGGRAKPR